MGFFYGLDGTKMAVLGLKMLFIAIFGRFWVQKLQITNLAAFGRSLIAQFPIETHKQNRTKNIFLRIHVKSVS